MSKETIKKNIDKIRVKNRKIFLETIDNLDSLEGLKKLKKTIYSQILLYIYKKVKGMEFNHNLNYIITGQPGTGKTTIAKIIGRLWLSIGYFADFDSLELLQSIENQISDIKNSTNKQEKEEKSQFLLNLLLKTKDYENVDSITRRVYSEIEDYIAREDDLFDGSFDKTLTSLANVIGENNISTEEYEIDPVSKTELISMYHGETKFITKKFMEKKLKNIFFLDEGYKICTARSDDIFGAECLDTMIEFIDKHKKEIIVIICGYGDLIENLYTIQPGIKRRFENIFELQQYTKYELYRILFKLALKADMKLSEDILEYLDKFDLEYRGADLQFIIKECEELKVLNYFEGKDDNIIDIEMIKQILQKYSKKDNDDRPRHMYI